MKIHAAPLTAPPPGFIQIKKSVGENGAVGCQNQALLNSALLETNLDEWLQAIGKRVQLKIEL